MLAPNLELKNLIHLQVSDWKRLGLALKLNSYDLNIIEKDNKGDTKTQTLKMFDLWLKAQPDASYEQLIKALREVGDKTVASSLWIKYGKYTPTLWITQLPQTKYFTSRSPLLC